MSDSVDSSETYSSTKNWLGIGTAIIGIYVGYLYPGEFLERVFVGIVAGLLGSWCLISWIRIERLRPDAAGITRPIAIFQLCLVLVLHFYRPNWLSGPFWGWVSWLFPAFLLITGLMAALRIVGLR
mgnify:CR=1 FL=1